MATAIEELTGGVLAPDTLSNPGLFTVAELHPPSKRDPRYFTGIIMTQPVVTAGYGGWSRVARPRRRALTEWVGRDSISISFDFMIDELQSGKGQYVEARCRNLDRMAGIVSGEPPLCSLSSEPEKMIPFGEAWAPHISWFIESLSWNPQATIVNRVGNRLRAAGTIIFTQFVDDNRLSAAHRDKEKSGGKGRGSRKKTYTVKRGDTLSSIAARKDVYGDASQWKKIAKANKIRDPKKLNIGKVLKIP